ncbi:hypothetical protein [Moorena sp. SIO3I6]|uniref:hypothetical protein n=1 Tax=Moorena sp. SIO3I6 TaxID=2607831 RepID=UPI0025DAD2EA|nr:hypothetical protein [Moorena sp. SIO3I6]
MGETTAIASGGDPQDRTGSPRPRCIATPYSLFPVPYSLFPVPCSLLYRYWHLDGENRPRFSSGEIWG